MCATIKAKVGPTNIRVCDFFFVGIGKVSSSVIPVTSSLSPDFIYTMTPNSTVTTFHFFNRLNDYLSLKTPLFWGTIIFVVNPQFKSSISFNELILLHLNFIYSDQGVFFSLFNGRVPAIFCIVCITRI